MKKILCMIMVVCLVCLNTICFASSKNQERYTNVISPRYISIIQTFLNLERVSSNKVSCYADNTVDYGNIAKVKVDLQKKNGDWETIKTWEDTYDRFAYIEKEYAVQSNCKYRMKVTFEAYTENMILIESDIQYSPEV